MIARVAKQMALLAQHVAPAPPVSRVKRAARPAYHLAPKSGWINDPNGPLVFNGTYHLFYQHNPNSSEWQWGLVWGHAKSKDLVNWEHLPVGIAPSPGLDQDGCFSGCATVDVDGRPSLLYTGVVRKPAQEVEPAISPQYESQLIAVAADPNDPDLKEWVKLPGAFLPTPPADMKLTGWRDPFVLERPSATSPYWFVMIGAGQREKCGLAMVYRSKDLKSGWEYVGPLCESDDSHMWECPIMATLTNQTPHNASNSNGDGLAAKSRHLFCVSPDYCVNMPQYWLGEYSAGKFNLDKADGPHPLDLGDIMYAAQVLEDEQGRTVLWAWMQEKQQLRPAGTYNSACCLCVPRMLYLSPDGKHMLQEPLPELNCLREQQGAWHIGTAAGDSSSMSLLPGVPVDFGDSSSNGSHMDLKLTVAKGNSDTFVLLLQPFDSMQGAAGAGISYCWSTKTLQVIHSTDLSMLERMAATPIDPPVHKRLPAPGPEEAAAAEAAAAASGLPMRCGGVLRASATDGVHGQETVTFRVLVDGSCLEVFTCSGQALGTRVYRGDDPPLGPPPAAADELSAHAAAAAAGRTDAVRDSHLTDNVMMAVTGHHVGETACSNGYNLHGGEIQLVCFGEGPAQLVSASAYQMNSMWLPSRSAEQLQPEPVAVPAAAAMEVLQGLVAAEAAAAAAPLAAAAAAAVPVVLPITELCLDGAVATAADGFCSMPTTPVPVSVEA